MPVPYPASTPVRLTKNIVATGWTSLVHFSQAKNGFSKISGSGSQLRAPQRVVRGTVAAAEEAGERDHFIDDRQIGVEMGMLFQELCQFTPAAGKLALDAANRQVGMKSALLLGITELRLERIVDGELQLLQLVSSVLDADPERAYVARVGERADTAAGDLERLKAGGDFAYDATDVRCFGVGHIPQELERQVHLLRPDTIDLSRRHSQVVDQVAGPADNTGRHLDGDERAEARHQRSMTKHQ